MAEKLRRQVSRLSNDLRAALEAELVGELQAAQIMAEAFDQAVSDVLGVNRTDARCLDIIERHGTIGAGELAREIGLSTGAVTALLDRLEHAGAVRRVPDSSDRRRVLVELTPDARRRSQELHGPLARTAAELLDAYSDRDLATILDFLRRGRELRAEQLAAIRQATAGMKGSARRAKLQAKASRAQVKLAAKELKSEVKQAALLAAKRPR